MASEDNSSDATSFGTLYLKQPHYSTLSPLLHTTCPEIPLHTLQEPSLANESFTESAERQTFNTCLTYTTNVGPTENSPWAFSQAHYSPLTSAINGIPLAPTSFQPSNPSLDIARESFPLDAPPNMRLLGHRLELVNPVDDQILSQSDLPFSQDSHPTFASVSPLSAASSMELHIPSPHNGGPVTTYSHYGTNFLSDGPAAVGLDEDINSEPYAKLIFRALMSAPGHRMVLKEIYDWFEVHTDKAKDPKSRGWQNSIRHNLSMNGVSQEYSLNKGNELTMSKAFRKEEQLAPSEDGRRNFVWVLEKAAIEAGEVQSTTRYRRPGAHKRVSKADAAFHRQRCGAKGGRASKGKQHRQRETSLADLDHSFFGHPNELATYDAQTQVKSEAERIYDLGPFLDTFTGIEQALPQSPEVISSQNATGNSLARHSPVTYEHRFLGISPTPTLTSASHTDPDNYDFEHITGCTNHEIGHDTRCNNYNGDALFCSGTAERSNESGEHFYVDWNGMPSRSGIPNFKTAFAFDPASVQN